jgi:TPP-dependent 2-oxoacid decarboxylase
MSKLNQNVGSFLIQRLYGYGVRHIFGVPGDFVLGFYQQFIQSNRFGLQDKLLQLVDKTNIPVVSTVLSKSTISEDHPCYLGVYEGAMGFQSVREYVESSDCLILLGALMTDINFGISPTPIEQSRSIYVSSEKLSIKHHNFKNIFLNDFLTSLIDSPLEKRRLENIEKDGDKFRNNFRHASYMHFVAKKTRR